MKSNERRELKSAKYELSAVSREVGSSHQKLIQEAACRQSESTPAHSSQAMHSKNTNVKLESTGHDLDSRKQDWISNPTLPVLNQALTDRSELEAILLQSYHQIHHNAAESLLVLVTGPSGAGKTMLVQSLQKQVTADQGYFLTGKFDQLQRREPYAAFCAAFAEFSAAVVARGEKSVVEMRSAVQDAIGDETAVLTRMIPALEQIMGRKKECPTTTTTTTSSVLAPKADDAMQRFLFVFRTFLRAVCSPEHPIVLVLDDLQWADPCSLDVLMGILTDNSNDGLVVVATCDSNVSPNSYLAAKLREKETSGEIDIVSIEVDNLDEGQVKNLLVGVLDAELQGCESLASIVIRQTDGNLFYIVQFIKWLQQSDLLYYNKDSDQWEWDVEAIAMTELPRLVSDFFRVKVMDQLSAETKEVLKLAACLGFHIEEEMIEYVLGRNVSLNLSEGLAAGALVVSPARGGYSFAHDGVQEAAYKMIPMGERELFHVELGRRLWQKLDTDEVDRHIFVLLSQFNVGKRLITREKERIGVATLCLHAGTKAAKSSTFRTAAVYLNLGIDLVGESGWRGADYKLTLTLHNACAEMEMCSSNMERMDELIDAVLSHSRQALDKMQAQSTRIYVLGLTDRQQEAIELGIDVLKQFDERFPRMLYKMNVMSEFVVVKRLLRGKSDEQLMRLPPIEDERKLACQQVLQLMFVNCLLVRPMLAPYVNLKMMKITLRHGLSPLSSLAFATYGLICLSAFHDVDSAVRYGQLGLKLLNSYGALEYLPRVYAAYYGVVHGWRYPISDVLEPLLRAHRVGLQTGDHEFAYICSTCYCFLALRCGVTLHAIMRRWAIFEASMLSTRHTMALRMSLPTVQAICFFMNPSEDPLSFKGEKMDIVEEENKDAVSGRVSCFLESRLVRMNIAYVFNAFEIAYELSMALNMAAALLVPTIDHAFFQLIRGMSCLAMARKGKDFRKHVQDANKTIKLLRRWTKVSPHNIQEKVFLLEGELASVCGRADMAYGKFTCAIELAEGRGFLYLHALANERVGHHFLALGQKTEAKPFFRAACSVYDEWGAKAKVRQLEAELDGIYQPK
jgi:histidine kinase